jgi:hypothetical protein
LVMHTATLISQRMLLVAVAGWYAALYNFFLVAARKAVPSEPL